MAKAIKRTDVHTQLRQKAAEDAEFRAQLLTDPKRAIQECLGAAIPEGMEVEVLEEGPSKLYLVLPAAKQDMALSDEDLDKVAGGVWDCTDCGYP